MNLDFKKLKQELIKQKWKVELTVKNHWRFIPPDSTKKIVIASGTPSCPFAIKHIIGDLKRSGFILNKEK